MQLAMRVAIELKSYHYDRRKNGAITSGARGWILGYYTAS